MENKGGSSGGKSQEMCIRDRPEVVDADFFDPGHLGKLFVVQLDCGIPQGTGTAADLICFRKSGNCFPSCLVLVQNSQKGGRGFAVSG